MWLLFRHIAYSWILKPIPYHVARSMLSTRWECHVHFRLKKCVKRFLSYQGLSLEKNCLYMLAFSTWPFPFFEIDFDIRYKCQLTIARSLQVIWMVHGFTLVSNNWLPQPTVTRSRHIILNSTSICITSHHTPWFLHMCYITCWFILAEKTFMTSVLC